LQEPNNLYIIVSPTARTLPLWPPKGYAGPSGRIDVIARAFLAVEEGSQALAILLGPPEPPKTLHYDPAKCKLRSERQAVHEIARALLGKGSCVRLDPRSPEQVLHEEAKRRGLILLGEEGDPGATPGGKAYLLGAHLDPPEDIMEKARRIAEATVRIGPNRYHTSHVIAFVEWSVRACRW